MGVAPAGEHNAVTTARTPVDDSLMATCPHTLLTPSGEAVGLPAGYQGSSEVGHLNIGAGRIVKQEITRINEALSEGTDGSFFKSQNFVRAMEAAKAPGAALHVMGLLQDEGVHAHQDHLFAILRHAASNGAANIWVHIFSDGRDTPPRSALGFIRELNRVMAECGGASGSPDIKIATLMGRYYAMDRGRNWALTDTAFDALVDAKGAAFNSPEDAVQDGYAKLKSPDGSDMTDEYIPPAIMEGYAGIRDGDAVVHFNFRQDRAIQLTRAFVEDDYPGTRARRPKVTYCGLTKYYDSFAFNILAAMDEGPGMKNILGEVLAANGKRQIRIAETQKYAHVTSFLNGKRIEPFEGEERVEIMSGFDPSTFADHPEMSAYEVADEVAARIRSGKYDLVVVNFANCDMVGHTGNFSSAVRAVEVVDECVGKLVESVRETGTHALITADHGNAEEMVDPEHGEPKTAHTVNQVNLIYLGPGPDKAKLREGGVLSDIAPTILHLMGIEKPADMTARNLIIETIEA